MAAALDDYNSDSMESAKKNVASDANGGGAIRGLAPGGPISGKFRPEGSKSLAQRFLVASSLSDGETKLSHLPNAADVSAAHALIDACGIKTTNSKGTLRVVGRPPSAGSWAPGEPLVVGESGTLARFATGVLGLTTPEGTVAQLVPEGTLARRQSVALFRALAGAGVGCEFGGIEGGFAVRLRSAKPPTDVFLEEPGSSQDVSALLFALAAHEGRCHLHVRGEVPSMPYVEMTAKVIESFGARIQLWNNSEGVLVSIEGPMHPPAEKIEIEPDASTAGTALVAACITGGELEIPGLGEGSVQGDVRIVEHLQAFGCEAGLEEGRMWAKGPPTQGAEVDFSREPDLAPAVVALAACAALNDGHESRLRGLHTLPGKESDRIRLMARGLRELGLASEAGADSLLVGPPRPGSEDEFQPPITLDPQGDHRMAFAFALFGLIREGVYVADSGCVAKSWPSFWKDLKKLGAKVVQL